MRSELYYEDQLKELLLFSLEKDKTRGIYYFKYFTWVSHIRELNQLETTESDRDFKKGRIL